MSLAGRIFRHARDRFRACSRPLGIQLRYRLLNRKLDRNQWNDTSGASIENYRRLAEMGWDEIREQSPGYFARLQASVAHTRGRVLEVGCGIGNMTRWIAAREQVSRVTAIDGSQAAVDMLIGYAIPKVHGRAMSMDAIELGHERFDCLVMCELIEHLYPDEEQALRDAVLPLMAPGASYVISAPVGWLEDPHHVRAFSRAGFVRHLRRFYGLPEGVDSSSGYSQVAWGPVATAPVNSRP